MLSISAENEASMMFAETPTVDQVSPAPSALSIITRGHRAGRLVGRQDAHLVIDQPPILEVGRVFAEVLAQRRVERIDRTAALGHRHQMLVADSDLDGCLRQRDQLADRVEAPFDGHPVAVDAEVFGHLAERAPRHQLEARLGAVVGVAVEFALLDLLDEARQQRMVGVDVHADVGHQRQHVGASRLVGDDDVAPVADQLGRNVLVGTRVLLHRRDVQAALVREGGIADVGRVVIGRPVQQFVDQPRDMGQLRQALGRDAGLVAHLEHQGRDQRHQIGVAAALAEPIDRAVHHARTGTHRRQAAGDRVFGVVVAVDGDPVARDMLADLADDLLDFVRQRAAVGVAQDDPTGAAVGRRHDAIEREFGVGLVAVEEVLGVEQRLLLLGHQMRDAVADHRDVLVRLDAKRDLGVEVPGLADQTHTPRCRCRPVPRGRGRCRRCARACASMPNAVKRERSRLGAAAKKASSVGLAPGQPPST